THARRQEFAVDAQWAGRCFLDFDTEQPQSASQSPLVARARVRRKMETPAKTAATATIINTIRN
ncbi:MAG TPA: hypothetical protein VHL50_08925, partial [Pyrinomonadaceae bacterium]|nr:hypothetical protein [Pyrinomonadaceae bacterium]